MEKTRGQEDYGGAVSGNFRHKGVPGQRGGSAPGGGGVALGGAGAAPAGDAEYEKLATDKVARAKEIEPGITKTVVGAVEENGGEMYGLDKNIKRADPMERKIKSETAEADGNLTHAEVAEGITDSVRYTAVFDDDTLVGGAKATQKALADDGWEEYDDKWRNYYGPGDAYDGYNTVYQHKTTGDRFELQLHTKKSLEIKNEVHDLYKKARVLPKGPERTALDQQMTKLWEAPDYQRPAGWESLEGKRMDQ